jgi:hypothetical protein
MSIIHVSHTSTLASAILAKADNTTVSTKTLKKIEEVAARLYGVNNSGGLRPIASPLGEAAFKLDIKACLKAVAAMPQGPAQRDLGALLKNIETRTTKTFDKIATSFNGNDMQDVKNNTTNYENNIRLAYLFGPHRGAKPE